MPDSCVAGVGMLDETSCEIRSSNRDFWYTVSMKISR